MQITKNTVVWMHKDSSFLDHLRLDPETVSFAGLAFLAPHQDWSDCDYIKIGTATIAFELLPQDEIILTQVAALRAEITKTQADAQAKVARLENQIANLLALPAPEQAD